MDNIKKIIGRNVRELREKRGWTRKMLVQAMSEYEEYSEPALGVLERGGSLPQYSTIEALARIFEVPQWQLFLPPDYVRAPTLQEAVAVIAALAGLEVRPPKRRRKPTTSPTP